MAALQRALPTGLRWQPSTSAQEVKRASRNTPMLELRQDGDTVKEFGLDQAQLLFYSDPSTDSNPT